MDVDELRRRPPQAQRQLSGPLECALSPASAIDAILQVGQGRGNVVEGGGLGEIHVPHRLVVTPQGRVPFGRRHEVRKPSLMFSPRRVRGRWGASMPGRA